MLERACRMIGDDLAVRGALGDETSTHQIFTNIHGKRGYMGGRRRMSRIKAQHEAIIFKRGAAARSCHQDGVERRRDSGPGRDVAACSRMRLAAAPHVMNKAPAT